MNDPHATKYLFAYVRRKSTEGLEGSVGLLGGDDDGMQLLRTA